MCGVEPRRRYFLDPGETVDQFGDVSLSGGLLGVFQGQHQVPAGFEPAAVKLTASAGQIRLSAQSQELGEAEETLPAEFAGDELTIGFNARYVLEALGPMDHPWTVVGLKDGLSPGVLLGAADKSGAPDDGYRCVIMPMRM